MEALALKLTEFPVVENFRVVLECEAGEVEEERLTTAYVGPLLNLSSGHSDR